MMRLTKLWTMSLQRGPGSSTAISFTAVLCTLGSSNPVSSTIKFLDSMQNYKNNTFTCLPNNRELLDSL